jgi:hypothetical protein
MRSILSSPCSLSLALILILLLPVGIIAAIELYYTIFPIFVISVSDQLLKALYRFVLLAAIVCCMIVILLQLTGGGINAH